uniref:phosphoribosylformylglycinamidine cyclo-ligase n=1 Tax=Anopheles epiroticus TaxID=199890 RepID=A0A182PX07_9DIPT
MSAKVVEGNSALGVYDLAGFSLGIDERIKMLPPVDCICLADVILGLSSSGVHSKGFSLVHNILKISGHSYKDVAPFSATGKTFAEELLVPTRIYVHELQSLLVEGLVKVLAYIIGSGFKESIPRVLPAGVAAFLDLTELHIPPIFGAGGTALGTVVKKSDPLGQCVIEQGFEETLRLSTLSCSLPKERIAVLISGSDSNLQALIDATRNSIFGIRGEIVLVVSYKAGVFWLMRATKAGIRSKITLYKDYGRGSCSMQPFGRCWSRSTSSCGVSINIHPALSRHKCIHAQLQALEAGDVESGCTVHFVDEGIDTGATILQERVPILRTTTEEALIERIHQAEHKAYPKALRLVANGMATLGLDGSLKCMS